MKHPMDHAKPRAGTKLSRFVPLARQSLRHPNTMALMRRPRAQAQSRLPAFARIEHGLTR